MAQAQLQCWRYASEKMGGQMMEIVDKCCSKVPSKIDEDIIFVRLNMSDKRQFLLLSGQKNLSIHISLRFISYSSNENANGNVFLFIKRF